MKVTLVRPKYLSVWESLACGYIGSYLKAYYQEPLDVKFYDGFFDDDKTIIEGAADSNFVGFSCTSPQMKHALSLAEHIKHQNPTVKTIFGGHHPSSRPHETAKSDKVNKVVVGEGEKAMLEILQGRWIAKLAHCPPIENLDTIPFPDRKLIRQERTLALTQKNDGERIASVLSGRGCPFHCSFCTGDRDVFGNTIRKRSVNNVLNEIAREVNYWRIDFIKFADAEVNSRLGWLQDFCREKIRRRINVPFGCNIHAAVMSKSTLELMRKANCREIWVGVESGSPSILKEMRKRITVEMVENVFRWAKQYGILRRAYFMVGLPTETRQDFDMTLRLAERLDADRVGMTIPCPYPGTQLYDSTKYRDVDWSIQDEYSNSVWETKYFTNAELHDLQKEFTDKFRDRLVWRQRKC